MKISYKWLKDLMTVDVSQSDMNALKALENDTVKVRILPQQEADLFYVRDTHVSKASYGIISVSNVDVTVKSDGITAQGDLIAPHKFIDLSCSFSFTDTDDMSKLKIHPHMKVH